MSKEPIRDKRLERQQDISDRIKILKNEFKMRKDFAEFEAEMKLTDPFAVEQLNSMREDVYGKKRDNFMADQTYGEAEARPGLENQRIEADIAATNALRDQRAANPGGRTSSPGDLKAVESAAQEQVIGDALAALDAAAASNPEAKQTFAQINADPNAGLNRSVNYQRVMAALRKANPDAYLKLKVREDAHKQRLSTLYGVPYVAGEDALDLPPASTPIGRTESDRAQSIISGGQR